MNVYHEAEHLRSCRPLIAGDYPLTSGGDPNFEQVLRATFCGQASWARGPGYCAGCRSWNGAGGASATSKIARACGKYLQIMRHRGARVPRDASACRYYEDDRQQQELLGTFQRRGRYDRRNHKTETCT